MIYSQQEAVKVYEGRLPFFLTLLMNIFKEIFRGIEKERGGVGKDG